MAACFSNSRAASRLPLLSNSIARRTLVSDLVKSLSGRNSPSTRSSKSSNFKFIIALPRLSTTDAGMGTRFELMRTMSFESTSSLGVVEVEPPPGLVGSDIGRGEGLGVFPSCRRPDWLRAGKAVQTERPIAIRNTRTRFNLPAPSLVFGDFARATLPILSSPIRLATAGVPAFYELCAARVLEAEVRAQ